MSSPSDMTEQPKVDGNLYRGCLAGFGLSMPFWLGIAYLVVKYG